MHVGLQLRADHGELPERGAEDFLPERRIMPKHYVEHGDQDEKQGEDRCERVVGDQRGEIAGLIVPNFFQTATGKASPGRRCWSRSTECRTFCAVFTALSTTRQKGVNPVSEAERCSGTRLPAPGDPAARQPAKGRKKLRNTSRRTDHPRTSRPPAARCRGPLR